MRKVLIVAPHAGAWIETVYPNHTSLLFVASHPTRVRGLKPSSSRRISTPPSLSHPTRVRGLKHTSSCGTYPSPAPVAPHAGAWIETRPRPRPAHSRRVAPHAGAWIETYLLRRLGLVNVVAPHAGAWIETGYCLTGLLRYGGSHPTRVRGLKPALGASGA